MSPAYQDEPAPTVWASERNRQEYYRRQAKLKYLGEHPDWTAKEGEAPPWAGAYVPPPPEPDPQPASDAPASAAAPAASGG